MKILKLTETYSGLKLLGKSLVEKKGKDHPGQGDLYPDLPAPSEKRKRKPTPRRRITDPSGRRAVDVVNPSDARRPGFKPGEHGTRGGDIESRGAAKGAEGADTASAKKLGGVDIYSRFAVAVHGPRAIGAAFKKHGGPIKFKNRTDRARKQNPHTATSPID